MFQLRNLYPAFDIGPHAVTVWGYVTHDSLEEVLSRSYFYDAGKALEPGALIYVSIQPRPHPVTKLPQGERRTLLVMVSENDREGRITDVRLVQDFGPPKPETPTGDRKRAA